MFKSDDILYEDNHIIVVLKNQMTACCPDESKDDNLLDQVKTYLKIAYNKVFGYYIEILRSNTEPIPENYIRKQRLWEMIH